MGTWRAVGVRWTSYLESYWKRFVNVKSQRRINVIFGHKADVLSLSLLVLNVQKTYKSKRYLNVKRQRPLDVYLLLWRIMQVSWTLCQDVDWTFKIDVIWTPCSEYCLIRKDAILQEVEQDSMT